MLPTKRSSSPTPAWLRFQSPSSSSQRRSRRIWLACAIMTICTFSLIFIEPNAYLLALKHGPGISPATYCRALLKASPLTTSLTTPSQTSSAQSTAPPNHISRNSTTANYARSIPASELLSRRQGNATFDHRIIHQSWSTTTLPPRLQSMASTWKRDYPDWIYVLWTDQDNLRLVEEQYPHLLSTYLALPKEIYRADMVRPLYLHAYGGIYVDLDTDSIRPLQKAFDDLTADRSKDIKNFGFVARMGPDPTFPHSIPNAFMASSRPSHPFFLSFANDIVKRTTAPHKGNGPEWSTGPVALWESVNEWKGEDLVIMPPSMIFAYSWLHARDEAKCLCSATIETFDREMCQAIHPDAWALSYWNHAWEDKSKVTFGK